MINNLSNIFQILVPMFTGISVAILYMKINKSNGATYERNKNTIARFLETVALYGFLPFFLIEAISKTPIELNYLFPVLLGLSIPALCTATFFIYKRLLSNPVVIPHNTKAFRYIVSTFGGGNRGSIFILILFGATVNFQESLLYFSLVDLGNFLYLLIVTSYFLKKDYGINARDKLPILNNYLLITIFVVIGYYILSWGMRKYIEFDLKSVLDKTVAERKFLFTLFLFAAITLRAKFTLKTLKGFFSDILAFMVVRIIVLIFLVLMLSFFLPETKYTMIAVIVLLLMPPSSILPSMLSQTVAEKETVDYINTSAVTYNMLYILLLIGVLMVLALNRL